MYIKKKKITCLILLSCLTCVFGCSNINIQSEDMFDRMNTCADRQIEFELFFRNSDLYRKIRDSCTYNVFYSPTKNSCIGTYRCDAVVGTYGLVDYLSKKRLFNCQGVATWDINHSSGYSIIKDSLIYEGGLSAFEKTLSAFSINYGKLFVREYIFNGTLYSDILSAILGGYDEGDMVEEYYIDFNEMLDSDSYPDFCKGIWNSEIERLQGK